MKSNLPTVLSVAWRECHRLKGNRIYLFCMVVFPVFVTLYFTSMMGEGIPTEMPVGVVDQDNTSTTRKLVRTLDAFQTTRIVSRYPSVDAARQAMQHNEIYGFIYFPKGTTASLNASRQPKISFYYSYASITAGALVFRDLKTAATLGSAGVGQATMRAKGYTDQQIKTFLQPIVVDLHPVSNPWINYNFYLSTMLIPGCIMLFVFLITAYSLGTELKEGTAKQWVEAARGNMVAALVGKLLPQTVVFLAVFLGFMAYLFGALGFPHPGGWTAILATGVLTVLAGEGFAVFIFGVYPSLRMAMSVCSLLGVLSFSMVGTAFPTLAMNPILQTLAAIFPLRHYFLLYEIGILNGQPLAEVWGSVAALLIFALLPLLVVRQLRRVMLNFVYIP